MQKKESSRKLEGALTQTEKEISGQIWGPDTY
jgi:hypothetical protein